MLHHLGQFRLSPEPASLDPETLALLMSERRSELEDLLNVLPPHDPDRAWVVDTHAALTRVARRSGGPGPRLVDCRTVTGPKGGVVLAAIDERLSGAVRPGDTVCAGVVASRLGDEQVRVEPRLYRKLCANGAIIRVGTGEDQVAAGLDVGEAVEQCFAAGAFAETIARLTRAAVTPVSDPVTLLLQLALPVRVYEVLRAREDEDMSAFGWLNALTARARSERDPILRLSLERKAEELLQHAVLSDPTSGLSRSAPALIG
jgi:hypothetical protein